MKYCSSCGACLNDNVAECPHCGSEKIVDGLPENENVAPADSVQNTPDESEATNNSLSVSGGTDTKKPLLGAQATKNDNSVVENDVHIPSAEESADGDDITKSDSSSEFVPNPAVNSESAEDINPHSKLTQYHNNGVYDHVDDTPATPEDEAFKKAKKKKIITIVCSVIGALAVATVVICLFTFGDFSRNPAYDPDEKTFVAEENFVGETEPPIAFVSNPPYEMSERFSDYQLEINGAVYQVPMPVSEIINSGWKFGSDEESKKILAPEETLETYFVSKDGALMYATVINFNKSEVEASRCFVSRIKVDYSDNLLINIALTGKLELGRAKRADVEKIIGESSDAVELGTGIVVTYENFDKKYAKLSYNKKSTILESVEYINEKKPSNFEEATEPQTTNEFGKTDDVTPETLGSNIISGYVQIEGDIYRMPIKVGKLLDNGWELSFNEDRAILYGEEHLFGTLQKGDVTINGVDVYNSSKSEKLIKNCEVINISASPDDGYEVIFPGNLKTGMKESDFKNLIGDLEYDFNEVNFDEYIFKNGSYTLMVVVDKDNSAVNYISMTYDKDASEK